MKIFNVGLSAYGLAYAQNDGKNANANANAIPEPLKEKRYQQLITQMNFYNKQFDPRYTESFFRKFF